MGRSRLAKIGCAIVTGLLAAGALGTPAAAAAAGTVQGTFTTFDDRPIAGAVVLATSPDETFLGDAVTDEDGHYVLTGIAAGGVQLQFWDQNRRQWSPGKLQREDATVYQLANGATLTVNEQQPATGTVAGRFTDAAGAGAAEVWVTVQGVGHETSLYASTDDQGAWTVDALPGTYRVSYQWGGSWQWAVQQSAMDAATSYTVKAGETVVVDDHKLPTGTVGGRLTDIAGEPAAGLYVALHRGDTEITWMPTDADGRFSFGETLAGDGYTLSIARDDGTVQWIPGKREQAQAGKFAVRAGVQTTIDDTLLSPATVNGRLVGADGTAKAEYHVSLTRDGDELGYEATTGNDGRWSIDEVDPGDYRISFTTPDYGRTQWAPGKDSAATAVPVAVGNGASVTVEETWLTGATLVVKAVDATTGEPISDFCVWVTTPGDGNGCATGSEVTVGDQPAGDFQVSVTPSETSYYLQNEVPVKLAMGETTTVSVPLTLGGKIAITTTARAGGAAVRGTCPAFVVPGRGGLPDGYGDCTDATGRATTTPMAAGTYNLFAVAPGGYGHQWAGTDGGTGDQRVAAPIVVKPGVTVDAPAVLLDKPGTITGVVSDATGKALADTNVAYSAWGDAGPAWDTTTDAQGRYTIGKLGPYAWPLLFGAAGFPRQWSGHTANRFDAETVTVTAGGSSSYDFTPAPAAAALKGTVSIPAAPAGSSFRLNVRNAVTGDQMGVVDGDPAADGGAYALPLIGDQLVKVAWSYHHDETSADGWYDHAADIETATEVPIPPTGSRELNLTIE